MSENQLFAGTMCVSDRYEYGRKELVVSLCASIPVCYENEPFFHLRKVEEDGETGQGRLGLWRGSVEAGEAGSAEVVGEDAVKCAAAGAHGGGSDLAQAHAVSPSGTVEDESGRN